MTDKTLAELMLQLRLRPPVVGADRPHCTEINRFATIYQTEKTLLEIEKRLDYLEERAK